MSNTKTQLFFIDNVSKTPEKLKIFNFNNVKNLCVLKQND